MKTWIQQLFLYGLGTSNSQPDQPQLQEQKSAEMLETSHETGGEVVLVAGADVSTMAGTDTAITKDRNTREQ